MDLFTIVPVFIGGVFLFILCVFLFIAWKGFSEWSHNNKQPVVSLPARVVTKRTESRSHGTSGSHRGFSTYYYATFELDSGERLEFSLRGKGYGLLVEGDQGTLTYQGTRYHGFERSS